jgi:hypothetical protein
MSMPEHPVRTCALAALLITATTAFPAGAVEREPASPDPDIGAVVAGLKDRAAQYRVDHALEFPAGPRLARVATSCDPRSQSPD